MKNQGVDFVIIRCGYTGYDSKNCTIDKCFEKNYANAKEAGLEIGVYYYSLAGRCTSAPTASNLSVRKSRAQKEALAEANFVLKNIKDKDISYPIFLDIEDPTYQGKAGKTVLAAAANKFCQTIEANANGYQAGVYASLSWLNNKIGTINSKYDIWVAQYYKECQYTKPYIMWQYSSHGRLNGYNGRLDVNFRYLSDKEITSESSLANAVVTLDQTSYTYSATAKKPKVSVTLNDTPLAPGKDYTLSYYKNVKAGTAYAVINGKGQYTDCKITPFKIKPYSLSKYEVLPIKDMKFTNKPIVPEVVVQKIGGTNVLTQGKGYKISCSNNTDVGTAKVKITGIGNYGGTIETTFNIVKATPKISGPDQLVYRKLSSGKLNVTATLGAKLKYNSTDTSVVDVTSDGSLKINGFGQCQIKAYCPKTANTNYASKLIPVTVDSSIRNLTQTAIGLTWVDLSWDKVGCASLYKVYRYSPTKGTYTLIKTTTENSIHIENLMPGAEYHYSVMACDPNKRQGEKSEPLVVTPNLKTIKGLQVTETKPHEISLSWNKQSEVTGYKVYRYNPNTKKYVLLKTIEGNENTSYTVSKLISAKEYKFKVISYYKTVLGPKAIINTCTRPRQVTITKTTKGDRSISLTWKKIRTTGYKIYYSIDPTFKTKQTITVDNKTTSVKIKGLKKGKKYYIKARAFVKTDAKTIYGKYSLVKSKQL